MNKFKNNFTLKKANHLLKVDFANSIDVAFWLTILSKKLIFFYSCTKLFLSCILMCRMNCVKLNNR